MKTDKIQQGRVETASMTRETSVGWQLKQLAARLDNSMSLALKEPGLNLKQFAILMTLLEADGITQREISQRVSLPGYDITRNLDVLEEKGFLVRQEHETSRRSFAIYLTENGKAMAPTLYAIVEKVNGALLSVLSDKEAGELKSHLNKLMPSQC